MLDPTLARTFVGRIVFAALCDKLFDIDEKLNIVPQLATGYEWSADSKALTIKLRHGVTFHDGEKLDAAAVKFNIERHKTMPGSQPAAASCAPVASVDVVDPTTVRLNLSAPFAPLLAALADRAGMMVSPKAAQAARRQVRRQAGLLRAVQVRRARRAGPHRARALRGLLEQGPDPLRPDHLHADRRRHGAPRQPASSGQLDFIERVAPSDMRGAARATSRFKIAAITEIGYQGITINVGKSEQGAEEPARQGRRACARPSSSRSTARASSRW